MLKHIKVTRKNKQVVVVFFSLNKKMQIINLTSLGYLLKLQKCYEGKPKEKRK